MHQRSSDMTATYHSLLLCGAACTCARAVQGPAWNIIQNVNHIGRAHLPMSAKSRRFCSAAFCFSHLCRRLLSASDIKCDRDLHIIRSLLCRRDCKFCISRCGIHSNKFQSHFSCICTQSVVVTTRNWVLCKTWNQISCSLYFMYQLKKSFCVLAQNWYSCRYTKCMKHEFCFYVYLKFYFVFLLEIYSHSIALLTLFLSDSR